MNDENIDEFEIVVALYNKLTKFDYISFIIHVLCYYDHNNELRKYFIKEFLRND